jgi:hypothetical protein
VALERIWRSRIAISPSRHSAKNPDHCTPRPPETADAADPPALPRCHPTSAAGVRGISAAAGMWCPSCHLLAQNALGREPEESASPPSLWRRAASAASVRQCRQALNSCSAPRPWHFVASLEEAKAESGYQGFLAADDITATALSNSVMPWPPPRQPGRAKQPSRRCARRCGCCPSGASRSATGSSASPLGPYAHYSAPWLRPRGPLRKAALMRRPSRDVELID